MPTVYLNGHDTEARLANEKMEISRIDREKDDVRTLSVPLFDIERVVVVGRASLTTPLVQRLLRHGTPLCYLSGRGRWLGTLEPTVNGHALRRLRQYELARDAGFALTVARALVSAKIRNSRRVLQRLAANRDQSEDPAQVDACNSLQALTNRAGQSATLDSLRGLEGLAAAIYFRHLGTFFPAELPFASRSRRPPRDEANALLSFTYTVVLAEVDGAVRAAGLDPCLGFLHEIAYGRPALSLDLLEPLRGPLGDLHVLRLLNHQLLQKGDFEFRADDGGTYLTREARAKYPPVEHPVVRVHPLTGKKILYVNPTFTSHIKGLPRAQSYALLTQLFDLAKQPEFQARLRWQPGTLAVWDNRSTQHYAVGDFFPAQRLLHRITFTAERAF